MPKIENLLETCKKIYGRNVVLRQFGRVKLFKEVFDGNELVITARWKLEYDKSKNI